MNILDYIEIWWRSLQEVFQSVGVDARFERSSDNVLNPSCTLNLRRGGIEADLVVWASGEADLGMIDSGGSVSHKHYEDLKNMKEMESALASLAAVVALSFSK